VSWTDNSNAKWTTLRDPTIPPLSEMPAGGGAQITRSFDPPNPTVFPLESGKEVSYKVTTTEGDAPPKVERDGCEVRPPDTIIVEAGAFTAWAIACQRGGESETLYYAPEIGAVVLSSRAKEAKTTRLTLVDYQKAGVPRAQQAAAAKPEERGGTESPPAPPQAASAANAEPSAPAALPEAPVTEKALPPPAGGDESPAKSSEASPAATTAAPASSPPSGPEAPAAAGPQPAAPQPPAAQPTSAQPPVAHPTVAQPAAAQPAAATEAPASAPAAKPAVATAPPRTLPPKPVPKPLPTSPQLAALAPAAPSASESGKYVVQYVSFNSKEDALKDWAALRARLPKLLGELKPRVDTVTTVGGTQLARFSLGPFASEAQAKQLCADLHAAGPDCWVRPLK